MLLNATSTAWIRRHRRKGRRGEDTDERPLVGPPGRARPALPRGGGIQGVQVRRARELLARALAWRMARARLARDVGRGPADRPGRSELDAGPDPARRGRARAGHPGADRPGAAARVGALRRRWEPGYGWNHGEAHHGGSAHAARYRNNSDASRRSQGA